MLEHSKEALLWLKMVCTDCQVKIKLTLVVGENKHFCKTLASSNI